MITANSPAIERPRLADVLAQALELLPNDREVLCVFMQASFGAGLDLDPHSVRRASDGDLRILCGRPAPWDRPSVRKVED